MAVHDLARIEEKLDRAAAGATLVSDQVGGVLFQSMSEVLEFSKLMSLSDTAVPKHLRGNPGACLRIVTQALEWRMSPFAVADKSYFVNDKIAYEAQLVHALIEQRAPLESRLRHRYEGEGDSLVCIVSGKVKGEVDPIEHRSPPIKDIKPKNSPLWTSKPSLQLYYNTVRDFCRIYFPEVILGIYSRDELEDSGDHTGPDKAKDITPKIGDRLKGNKGRGFDAKHVEKETAQKTSTAGGSQVRPDPEAYAAGRASRDAGKTLDTIEPPWCDFVDLTADHQKGWVERNKELFAAQSASASSAAEGAKAGEAKLQAEKSESGSPDAASPAGTSIEVPDAYAMGQEAKRQGKPLDIPPELAGDDFAPHRDAYTAGFNSEAVAA